MSEEKEVWKDIAGYEGLYMVSSFGRVKSLKNDIILKPRDNRRGYVNVALFSSGRRKDIKIHRLVALNFLPKVDGKTIVNHLDGNKLNNRADNLEWSTHSQNTIHSFENGLQPRKLTNEQVSEIRENKNCLSQGDLAKQYNICQQMVSMIFLNKRRLNNTKQ